MISIIMPIRNEERHIKKTIESILNQKNFHDKYEIIIADGMSTDNTRDIIDRFIREGENIILIDNYQKIVPTGFNMGLSRAKGEIIIRVDGHTVLKPDYILNCLKSLKENNAANVGGLMNARGSGFIDELVSMATSSIFGVGNSYFHFSSKSRYVDTVFLGAWRKEMFYKYGGFDEELVRNQDDEFNFRLTQNGEKIWLDTSIKSIYFPRNSLKKLFKQYFQYGFYKIRLLQKRGGFSSIRHFIPGSFVMCLIISIYLYYFNNFKTPLFLIGISYVSTNIFFSFTSILGKKYEGLKTTKKFLKFILVLPLVFFIIHFSYGIGSLAGLIYFFKQWNEIDLHDFHFKKIK